MRRRSLKEVLADPRADEYYVLVTRFYPTALRMKKMRLADSPIDVWNRDLAPSRELLKDYKAGRVSWQQYVARFREEKEEALPSILEDLRRKAGRREVVLVCLEGDEEYPRCHTWVILELCGSRRSPRGDAGSGKPSTMCRGGEPSTRGRR